MQNLTPTEPGEILSIDFYGPLPTARAGMKYILVTIDAFTKFVKLYPMVRATAAATIDKIFKDYIPKYGKVKKILCDQGTQFTSKKWQKKVQDEGIQLIFTSVRHPQCNIVERVNRELSRFFRSLISSWHTTWINWVPVIEECMNEVYHDTTEFTPKELHLGEKPTRVWAKYFTVPTDERKSLSSEEKLMMARERIRKKGLKRAEAFNRAHNLYEFQEGDLVVVKANRVSKKPEKKIAKFLNVYEGPYRLAKKIGKSTFLLKHVDSEIKRGIFNSLDFQKYYPRVVNCINPLLQSPGSPEKRREKMKPEKKEERRKAREVMIQKAGGLEAWQRMDEKEREKLREEARKAWGKEEEQEKKVPVKERLGPKVGEDKKREERREKEKERRNERRAEEKEERREPFQEEERPGPAKAIPIKRSEKEEQLEQKYLDLRKAREFWQEQHAKYLARKKYEESLGQMESQVVLEGRCKALENIQGLEGRMKNTIQEILEEKNKERKKIEKEEKTKEEERERAKWKEQQKRERIAAEAAKHNAMRKCREWKLGDPLEESELDRDFSLFEFAEES